MSGEIIALHRCRKCGGSSIVVEVHGGERVSTWRRLCAACFEAANAAFEANRRLFEMLIEAGVERGAANAMMIAKIEAEAA